MEPKLAVCSFSMSDVTRILHAIDEGDPQAADELLPVVYAELRRLAAQKMAQEAPGQTLNATALVHEAYVRLVDVDDRQQWDSRGHFFAAAAEAMRRILIENVRRKQRVRHGGEFERVDLLEGDAVVSEPSENILELDEALEQFAKEDPEKALLVKLRYFAGMSEEEAAEVLEISRATASRHWAYARAWLYERMSGDE